MASKHKNLDELLSQGKELIEFYRLNPCIAAYDLLGVDLAPVQRLVFSDMWFRNYVIAVCGRGLGKSTCVNSLSFINDKGLIYLHEILPPIPSYLNDGEEDVIDWDDEIYTSEGFRKTKKLCLEKGIVGKKIVTQNRFEHMGSNHHPLLVLNNKCEFVYKGSDEFKIGDRICIQRNQNSFGNNIIPIADAYLIGLFIGDGSIGKKTTPNITSEDEETKMFCKEYCTTNNISYRISDDKRTKNTSNMFFKRFDSFFEKYNVDRVTSYTKSVPYSVRTATKEVQVAFLQGYFDTDGTVHNTNGGVSCCSVSKKLLKEIQLLLLNFGIVSRVRKKKTKSKFGKAYLLDIFSEDAFKFKELIGFRLKRKQSILDTYFDSTECNVNKDTIPYALQLCYSITEYYHRTYRTSKKPPFRIRTGNKKELSYERLHRFLTQCREVELEGFSLLPVKEDIDKLYAILQYNYYYDTVASVEDWKGDCYDFEMDMEECVEPNYFANGFINHNTFMLGVLASLSAMLYPGNRIGLIGPVFRQSLSMISGTYDTFWTSSGLKSTSMEMYESVVPNITMTQSLYKQNTILSKWMNDDRACMSIETTKGFTINGSTDHSIVVLNKDLDLTFKELQDIKDEYIAIKYGFNYFGNNNSLPNFDEFVHDWRTKDCVIPNELTTDLSYWLGLLTGDGCVSVSKNKRKQRVDFVSEDQDLLDAFENYLRRYFLFDKDEKIDRRHRKNNTWEIQYFCKKLVQYLLKCGFTKTTALDKKIPDVLKKASREHLIAFLQGLYDTDGGVYIQTHKPYGNTHCEVAFNTSSRQLAKEVQAILLNVGIVSSFAISKKACIRQLPQGNKPSKCAEAYKVRITGQVFLKKFRDMVGFRSIRKNKMLVDYMDSHFEKEDSLRMTTGLPQDLVDKNTKKVQKYADDGIYFVNVKDRDYFFAPTVDIEVESEDCYWASGFINHNSKMIFSEVEKLYDQSYILREACVKRPTRGSDTCYLKFKSAGGRTPSYIEALPLGDGNKIRGSRFYLILVDELAQVPNSTLDLVLRPMGATALAPMERVRRIEEQTRLINAGLATAADFEEEKVNKMIMTSSGYYKFNHMWRRMKDHWKMMDIAEAQGKVSEYSVWQVPYWDLPDGFLDKNNIAAAKRIMSSSEYSMEYEAAMISDSEGFFKASMLEECTVNSDFTIKHRGDSDRNYVLGIDPNQGGKASCGAIVVEMGRPNKIVNVLELKSHTTQGLTKATQELCSQYNVIRVFMDRGGGGKAVCDLLEEGYNNQEPIIDRTNPEHDILEGRHILEMVNFNPGWISDANFTLKAMLEDKSMLFPAPPVDTISDIVAKAYTSVEVLKSQMLSIVVTQTATGVLHFDTPSKGMNKDLYSGLILAAQGIKMVEKELGVDDTTPLFSESGLIRPRNAGSNFDYISASGNIGFGSPTSVRVGLSAAVLSKKKK